MPLNSLRSGWRILALLAAGAGVLPAQTALTITTASLPTGLINRPYSFALNAAGGTPPYTWSGDTVPGGFSISPGGILSGTAPAAASLTVVARVTDKTPTSVTRQFTLSFVSGTVTITTPSQLPPGVTGAPYQLAFTVDGGLPPYIWAASGSVPVGLTLDPASGVLSGVPAGKGTSAFTVQVGDSAGDATSKNFTITINPPPLVIVTDSLFNATVGLPYSQTLVASGGVPPYKWSNSGSLPGGITLDAGSGTLSGSPAAAGSFTLAIQVTDSAGTNTSGSLTLVVSAPKLNIITGSPLPAGTAGVAYAQTLSAIGGTAPYSWSLSSGSLPGLTVSSAGVLSGTPTAPGSFSFTIGVSDTGGQTGTKTFALTINPGPLTITTAAQLPDGALGQPFAQTITAAGGTPPYTWSATGLPDGLSIDSATGIISGSAASGGAYSFAVTVTDSARVASTSRLQLNISMPALPGFTISGLPGTVNPTDQPKLQFTLASPYPATITGQLSLSFVSAAGGGDGTIQFATGSRTATFTILAGSTSPAAPLGIQVGTVAGTIQVTVQSITAPGQPAPIDITPAPAPSQSTKVSAAAPAIVSAKLNRTSSGFSIQVTGYSTSREVTQAVFHFTAASGSTLQSSDVTVAVQPLFSQWFQDTSSAAFGSQFTFNQPFTVQGDASAVIPGSVTLTNSLGSNTANITQ